MLGKGETAGVCTVTIALSRVVPSSESWSTLGKGGTAGLYTVVMALSWWICRLKIDDADPRVWDAVDDVKWVLHQVHQKNNPVTTGKRTRANKSPHVKGKR
jgi:hypothetical protein